VHYSTLRSDAKHADCTQAERGIRIVLAALNGEAHCGALGTASINAPLLCLN
jgi:hypothetical protein